MDPTTHIDVHVNRHFTATPEQVFDAWLVPREMGRWMFGANLHDMRLLRLDVDPRVGGRFLLLVQRSGHSIEHTGHYLQIERPHRLAMASSLEGATNDAPSRVEIDLAPTATGCMLELTHRLIATRANDTEHVRDGWNAMLHALGELFT